ncbi:hypothetical protein C8J56DRAFT_899836 [Mycena floridula]|nr:hypothetical protein C8J56DRAFT_899836 [Mycena floridula]
MMPEMPTGEGSSQSKTPSVELTDDSREGLIELNEPLIQSNLDLSTVHGDQLSVESDTTGGPGVDLTLPFFHDLLSDEPVDPTAGLGGNGAAKSKPCFQIFKICKQDPTSDDDMPDLLPHYHADDKESDSDDNNRFGDKTEDEDGLPGMDKWECL